MLDIPITQNEARDSAIEFLAQKYSHSYLSKTFGISRQRIEEILSTRAKTYAV